MVEIKRIGINYLNVEFEDKIDQVINKKVRTLWQRLREKSIDGIVAMIPTYRSLLIEYDPIATEYQELEKTVLDVLNTKDTDIALKERVIVLPVLYGGEHGPDLETVASHNNLTPEQVIDIHTSGEYLVYMLGFNPGFPYLGGLDERIHTPRLQVPRTKVPAGSVGIAGAQTGVYTTNSPGGWQLIGHTPLPLFDPGVDDPVLLRPGDVICFRSVKNDKYQEIKNKLEQGNYTIQIEVLGGEEDA